MGAPIGPPNPPHRSERPGPAVALLNGQVHLALQYADRIIALRSGALIEDAPTASFDSRALEQIYERAGDPPCGASVA